MSVDIERLKALCEKATPGPWRTQIWKDAPDGSVYAGADWIANSNREDITFIAAARTALPDALGEIERLRGLLSLAVTVIDERRAKIQHARESTAMCRLARRIDELRKEYSDG